MSFKFNVGDSSRISMDVTPFHEGWTYFTTDGEYYADIVVDGENKRVRVKGDSGSAAGGREIAVTLASDGWIDNKQSIAIEGLTADQSGIISVAQSATVEEEDAAASARLKIFSQEAGTLTIQAVNGAPTCDVPVSIILFETSFITPPPPPPPKIYGAEWGGTSTAAWTRTDDAVDFADPVPAVANGTGSSPFDSIMPWAGMVRVSSTDAGALVAIPKFYYKWTKTDSALKLQISDRQVEGFFVSPAHADREDGVGERDIVYVGRYHCNSSSYKSSKGTQKVGVARSVARDNIHALGEDIWQFDYAMRVTIQMLYLVEFASWDSQAKIGYGCSSSGSTSRDNSGQTDSMAYHTGTTAANRTTYGYVQYRNIEGLWDTVYDWIDGCYYNENGINIIKNPVLFNDSSSGLLAGLPTSASSGLPSVIDISSVGGLEWVIYPTATTQSYDNTYVTDHWGYNGYTPCLYGGGYYSKTQNSGLFCVYSESNTGYAARIGCRLMKLPN